MTPISLVLEALEGLSVGDAFGQCFFSLAPDDEERRLGSQIPPEAPWLYTDDTEMAMSVVLQLSRIGEIDQAALATSFAEHYSYDRGYGPSMHRALARIRAGESWREVSTSLQDGQGSLGNGAAMRAAPIGAFFARHEGRLVQAARLSAEVTHFHPEGIAGAIAVAAAAGVAAQARQSGQVPGLREFLLEVVRLVPESEVRSRLKKASAMERVASIQFPAAVLGAGQMMAAHDTVPFALWCCGQSLTDYVDALWLGVSAAVDRDTICAIIGGVVGSYVGSPGIPAEWRNRREALPDWFGVAEKSAL